MKKIIFTVALLTVLVAAPIKALALNETDLLNKVKATYNINGKNVRATAEVITQVENYLNAYDLNDGECEIIANKIDEAVALARTAGATEWGELSAAQKNQMIAIANDIVNQTSVNASLTSDGKVTIFNPDGSVFASIDDAVTIGTTATGASTSYTGTTTALYVILGLCALAGAGFATSKVFKAQA